MGADNWATCPNCRVAAVKAREALQAKAEKAYGKKPADEYLRLFQETQQPLKLEQTLREDYGIGIGVDGEFGVGYKAHCTTCDATFEFKHTETAIVVPDKYKDEAESDDPYGYNYRKS